MSKKVKALVEQTISSMPKYEKCVLEFKKLITENNR